MVDSLYRVVQLRKYSLLLYVSDQSYSQTLLILLLHLFESVLLKLLRMLKIGFLDATACTRDCS